MEQCRICFGEVQFCTLEQSLITPITSKNHVQYCLPFIKIKIKITFSRYDFVVVAGSSFHDTCTH